MKKLLVVDGNSILNRSYYGIHPLTTKEGIFTNAVYGMIMTLLRQMEEVQPDICAIAFDRREPTFRHEAYDAYKAGRHAMPEELRMQFPYAKDCARAMGFAVVDLAGYEADDILGTLAKQASDAGDFAYVLTGDRDSLQLIGDRCTVLLASNKETVTFDREHFVSVYGVQPEQFVDVKALMGDTSDNIPGVAGIGEKTALKLISEYGSLDGVYAGGLEDKKIAKGVKAKLGDGKENAYFSQKLSRIVTDAPLAVPFSEIPVRAEAEDRAALRELFVRLEFSALIKRMGLDASDAETETQAAELSAEETPLTPAALAAMDDVPPAALVYDAEHTSLHLCTEAGSFVCTAEAVTDFAPFFANRDRTLWVHDCKSFFHALEALPAFEAAFDTMLAGYLLNPSDDEYTPARMAMQYLHIVLAPDAAPGVLAKAVFQMVPPLTEALRKDGMEMLYTSVELPLASVLCRMETRGFRIDTEGLKAYGEELGQRCEQHLSRIHMMAGKDFNVNSPKQLSEVLFDTLALPSPTTKRSTNAEVLEKLRPYHPIIDEILEYRQVSKLKSTYADGLLKVADAGGRIHSSFNQTVTATGRLSSAEPNLQNIPIRTELGRQLRRFFVASDTDHVLVDADYSQIELRLLAAISGDETMIDAFRHGVDIHAVTASQVFGVPIAQVTPEQRKRAKAVNFGIVYGISGYSLGEDIGVSKRQADRYIQSYHETYPQVSAYLQSAVDHAKENGYVTTLWGRRRYIPELTSSKKMVIAFGERVAMNSPIQGSAADIIKAAMIGLDRALEKSGLDARLILQVHDELIVECHRDCMEQVKEILREEMEHVVSLAVPLTVDVEAGFSWYEGH